MNLQSPTTPDADVTKLMAKREAWEKRQHDQRLAVIVLSILAVLQWDIYFNLMATKLHEHPVLPIGPWLIGAITSSGVMIATMCLLPSSGSTKQRTLFLAAILVFGTFGPLYAGYQLDSPLPLTVLGCAAYAISLRLALSCLDPYPPALQ
ncbi:MAG TPA: hypothetical protein VK694_01365 [Verrucomicrobiae bacterium]|nr:hypothetical protein [Verrucomicrobiae bacterium]